MGRGNNMKKSTFSIMCSNIYNAVGKMLEQERGLPRIWEWKSVVNSLKFQHLERSGENVGIEAWFARVWEWKSIVSSYAFQHYFCEGENV